MAVKKIQMKDLSHELKEILPTTKKQVGEIQKEETKKVYDEEKKKGNTYKNIIVDGKEKKLNDIKFGDKVTFINPIYAFKIVIIETLKVVLKISPEDTGLYKDSFYIFFDSKLKKINEISDNELDKVNEIFFTNIQPYSRKIENFHYSSAKKGVFREAENILNKKFSNEIKQKLLYFEWNFKSLPNTNTKYTINRYPGLIIKRPQNV